MTQLDELGFQSEKKCLEDSFRDSLKEMRKISSFLKNFINIHQEMGKLYENKDNLTENDNNKNEKKESEKNTNSFLFSNINNIYESFNVFMKTSQNLISSMENDLVKPLDDFIKNQLDFYNNDLNQIKKINYNYKTNKLILDNSRNNYYISSYISNKVDSNEIDNSITRGEYDLNIKRDLLIKKKMIARNDEFIYKYKIYKNNKNISDLNEEYDSLLDNVKNIEVTKVHFIQSLLDKYKKYLTNYVQFINNFISDIDKFNSREIGEKETVDQTNIFTKFKEGNKEMDKLRIPKHNFKSYQQFYEKIKDKKNNNLDKVKREAINKSVKMKENDCSNLIKEFVYSLLIDNDISQ